MSIRKAVVSGSFYPDKKEEILKYINHFNSFKTNDETFEDIKAIIVPHAGYIYSGFTANLAYKLISKKELENIVKFIKENLGVNIPWHISAFHPDYKEQNLERTEDETLQMAFDIAKSHRLNYVYIGNSTFKNDTVCKNCGEVLIKRKYFSVLENRVIDGICPKCKTKVDGVFK